MSLLNAWFNAFLRNRRAGNLFRRRAMPEAGFGPGSAEAAPFALTTGLVTLAQQDEAELLATLGSHADGLSPHEAEERLATLGPNEVDHEKPLPWWRHLWQCYRNPFNLLLTVLAAVSWSAIPHACCAAIPVPRPPMWPTSTSVRTCTAGARRACWTCRSANWCPATTSCCRPAT